jgi:hypothetical protein
VRPHFSGSAASREEERDASVHHYQLCYLRFLLAVWRLSFSCSRIGGFHSEAASTRRLQVPHVSGVDIAVIALWLGQESIETTNAYVHANLAMKEKALGKTLPMNTPFRRFHADDRLLAFLESI